MKNRINKLITLLAFFHPIQAHSQATFTEVEKTTLYSVYHQNPQPKFKGTIIFQNGSGSSLEAWTENKTFFHCIKKIGNLLLYDRSGLGKSPPDFSISNTNPITAQLVNSKLIQLLKRNQARAPYILVSHSYGGLYAGHFARKYPNLVAGMLMVDPVPADFEYSDTILEKLEITRALTGGASAETVYELLSLNNPGEAKIMTADSFYQQLGFQKTKEQVAKLPPMGSHFPVKIISSSDLGENAPIKGDWYTLQQQWLNLNPHSKIFKVQGGHFLQLIRPKLICEQLNQIVEASVQSSESRQ